MTSTNPVPDHIVRAIFDLRARETRLDTFDIAEVLSRWLRETVTEATVHNVLARGWREQATRREPRGYYR